MKVAKVYLYDLEESRSWDEVFAERSSFWRRWWVAAYMCFHYSQGKGLCIFLKPMWCKPLVLATSQEFDVRMALIIRDALCVLFDALKHSRHRGGDSRPRCHRTAVDRLFLVSAHLRGLSVTGRSLVILELRDSIQHADGASSDLSRGSHCRSIKSRRSSR